jgi:formylglycine-generating enzyme required for sulfatase activity
MGANSNPANGHPFIPASERGSWENPYRPGQPAGASSYYDRTPARRWVHRQLSTYRPDRPPLIWGRPGSGKTSFLHHLERTPFTGYHFSVISAGHPSPDNSPALWGTIAVEGIKKLQAEGLRINDFPLRAFMKDPQDALSRHFLQPVADVLTGTTWVLAIDDAHHLFLLPEPRSNDTTDLLTEWAAWTTPYPQIKMLLAATPGEPDALPPAFAQLPAYNLPPLPREDAYALLQGPVPYAIYDEVAAYIYDLTGGHPAALQALGHALFARWQQGALSHITTADALAVIRQEATSAPQTGRPDPESLVVGWRPAPTATHTGRKQHRLFLVGAGVLLITILLLFFRFRPDDSTPVAAIASPAGAATSPVVVLISPPAAAQQAATAAGRPTSTQRAPETAEKNTPTAGSQPASTPLRTGPEMEPTGTRLVLPVATLTPTTPPSATPRPEQIVREMDGMPMMLVPAGTFVMGEIGDRPEVSDDETPEHPVTLEAFYMDRYEVSVAQFADFLNELAPAGYQRSCPGLGCFFSRQLIGTTSYLLEEAGPDSDRPAYSPLAGYENYPANHVSWYGARDYCAAMGARLPTEAEWEYAARGTDGRIYPWGNEPPDESRAVFASDSFTNLKPVDALPEGVSPFGVFGLAGSVWEWVADYYAPDYYGQSPTENPTGPVDGPGRVTRGGGWPNNNQADRIRATNRNSLEPAYLSSDLGFRCARSVE